MFCPNCGSSDIDPSTCIICDGMGTMENITDGDEKSDMCEYCDGTGFGQEGFYHCLNCESDF